MREQKDIFVFLEIFSREGGIQSYVKDILTVYGDWASCQGRVAQVLLLRDSPDCENLLEGNPGFRFQYFKTLPPMWGRAKLAGGLGKQLVLHRPRRVFCGHINLVPLVQVLCQPLGIPYTVLTYGKEVWEPLPGMAQRGLQQANCLWTISRYSRDRACEANGLQPSRFELLPCAVDEKQFTPGPKPPELLERYGLQGCKVLMTVARLWSGDIYKGVDVTIRALPQIAQAQPDVKYLVIGRGDDQPRLQGLAQELGVSDRVVFAGFVPTEELARHYRVADAYIMPSQEGFGIVYLEAMACGKPVLSGDADGSADPLQDGKLGWQVPHRDPQAVAAACIEMLRGEDRRCDGDWLRQETIWGFGTDAFTQRVKQLIEFSD
ncbi:glycosyltransferase family 4 protein [Laspinema olomoucense]|uniref:glycosyltransferase family 4 protein n=1 Tax=Laspinema olomoucense TaxID=3231600 RepID=UPI0021BB43AE|nr:glycosyltransferase family 4 protein [Laspinema sp. D3d]MCT7972399.1 glycosyltransferase family 4 protein [Laspinema sp. D3d]